MAEPGLLQSPVQPARQPRLNQTFAALKHRNYRLWFVGQIVSLIGTWMQTTAQGYLIYELTKSPAYLGYVGFVAGLPVWLLTLYAGAIADRVQRRNLLLITQAAMMVLAFTLAVDAFSGAIQPWHILIMAFLLGIANAFDAPARQAFVRELVDRTDMTNAIALNSTMFNSATAVGPAVAGLTYALFGPGWCFTINGISFIAVIIALAMMRMEPLPVRTEETPILADLGQGLRYVANHSAIRILIVGLAVMSLFGQAFMTLMPAWAVRVLGGDATTNGLLQSARGVGALIGGLMIASLGAFAYKGKLLTLGSLLFPCLLLVFAAFHVLPVSLLTLVGIGWSFVAVLNMINALIQTHVEDRLRGRVMGVYTLTFFGLMPIGALLAGSLATWFGEPVAIAALALVTLGFAVLAYLRLPMLRALE